MIKMNSSIICVDEVLLNKYLTIPYDDMGLEISSLKDAIRLKDVDRIFSLIKAAVADLPTIVQKDICENYYESVTHLIFRLTGFRVTSELQSVNGRSDIVLETNDAVFIFELYPHGLLRFSAIAFEIHVFQQPFGIILSFG